jgi:hypothetical protein
MKPARKLALFSLTAISLAGTLFAFAAADDPASDSALTAALCPIVYRLDESASAHGYHYTFYGNGFFINDQGYLLTVAHVLDTFRDSGQPSIQVTRPNSPPQLLPLTIIAKDTEHDVAIVRVTPNPFTAHYRVTYLPLATDPAPGQAVLALSLHPVRPRNAQSFQMPAEDRSAGEVLSYESTQLEQSAPAAQVFLLSHPVTLGQSGSPVLAADSHAVVGLVEGRWLRSSAISLGRSSGTRADTPGAAIPIRYAIALLDQKGIAWHAAEHSAANSEPTPKP